MKEFAIIKQLLARFSGFSLIGGANTLLSMAIIFLLNEMIHVNYVVSYCIAYVLTVFLAYLANTLLVFRAKIALLSCLGFFGSYLSGMLLGMLILWLVKHFFPQWNATWVSYGVIPVTMVWNFYFVNKILSQRSKKNE